jgi:hypothetical protein
LGDKGFLYGRDDGIVPIECPGDSPFASAVRRVGGKVLVQVTYEVVLGGADPPRGEQPIGVSEQSDAISLAGGQL